MRWKRKWGSHFGLIAISFHILLLSQCASSRSLLNVHKKETDDDTYYPPVQLHVLEDYVVLDNGIVNVTLSTPAGMITGIEYNGIDNLLEYGYTDNNRGYWDVVWSQLDHPKDNIDKLDGTNVYVVQEDDDQVELSFVRTWNSSDTGLPLNIDKRCFVCNASGFFWILLVCNSRALGRLAPFSYVSRPDSVQASARSVDDKYQYSSDNKDNRVHGWICSDPPTGFWIITPSNEFKTAGPVKQDLTSHAGPISLSMFFSTHYAGMPLMVEFHDGEPWKKVFGPVFIYLNSVSAGEDPLTLWSDANEQMLIETEKWPYDFPLSDDFPYAEERGIVSGRLLVKDGYINERLMIANSAYIGLAPPGELGSWQRENKGYQFWTQTDSKGYFLIDGIRAGNYNLYAWVPGFIGDYKCNDEINVEPGSIIRLRNLVYDPPRSGPTLWEIGIPDRSAAEFFIPDPNPTLLNQLYVLHPDKFRQYGLWDRYTDLYPDQDLVYTVETCVYQTDWYFAHVNRNIGNKTYIPTRWTVLFNLIDIDESTNYTLQLALASANEAELQVWINVEATERPHFTTGLIGNDNTIARHGIHGLYWLYSIGVPGSILVSGTNTIFLTQSRGLSPWRGVMYDYIRLEGPPSDYISP
ncbi:hypothetical protein ACS0TY_028844 [Phlomoides rotata]